MNNREATEKFQLSQKLFGEGRYAEALGVLDELNGAFPDTKNILYPRALCLWKLGRLDEARGLCEHLIGAFSDPRSKELLDKINVGQAAPPVASAADLGWAANAPPTSPTSAQGVQQGLDAMRTELLGYVRPAYPNMDVRIEPLPQDRSRMAVFFREPLFEHLYPMQRFHHLSHLIPEDFQRRASEEGMVWFELAPGESPEGLRYPDEELIASITPDVMKCVGRAGIFDALDDLLCPLDGRRPRALCYGDFRNAKSILESKGFGEDERFDILHVFMAAGGYCDCEILYNVAEESRLAGEYWSARAEGREPYDPHQGSARFPRRVADRPVPRHDEPEEFRLLVQRAVADTEAKNAAQDERWRLGESEMCIDYEAGMVVFLLPTGVRVSAPLQFLGAYVPEDGMWCWAWDDPAAPAPVIEHAKQVLAYGRQHGIARLTTAEVACSEEECWELAALACFMGRAQGMYCVPNDDALVFLSCGELR